MKNFALKLFMALFAMTLLLGIVPLFGSFLAYTRLVMSAFGLFVAYGALLERRPAIIYAAVLPMALLQALFILLHTSNHWVA